VTVVDININIDIDIDIDIDMILRKFDSGISVTTTRGL